MSDIQLSGFVTAQCVARTVADLREFVAWCDTHKVDGDVGVEFERDGTMFVALAGETIPARADWIECGEHLRGDERFDLIIDTHSHPEREIVRVPE